MKPLCCNKIVFLLVFLLTNVFASERYAFIYSKNIDDRFINFYDKVVVEADAIDNIYAIRYPEKMVAYVSVGEIEPWRKTKTPYQQSWVISKNKTWNSLVADLNKEAYQNFIFERVAKLHAQGYRNFFLDTMDSYHVTSEDKELFKTQQKALISFIHKLHIKYPKSKIIVNRGFELLDKIHKDIDAVVAESLIARYNHAKRTYVHVPKNDQTWLLNNFKKAQKYGLDTISIDYTNKSSKQRVEIAKKIKKLGIIPYVTDGLLQEQGECEVERIRRDVLILFNQSILKEKNSIYSEPHHSLSLPIEHYGYVPILYDMSTKKLPLRVEDKYHSVIIWADGETKNDTHLYTWVKDLKQKGIKVLFFNSFLFSLKEEHLTTFQLSKEKNLNSFYDKSSTIYHKSYEPYEMTASLDYKVNIINSKNIKAVVSKHYKNGQVSVPIAITNWGGYALDGSFLRTINDANYWSINPYIFIKEALQLDDIPMPDPTTEAGRRILFIHVDGDGFMEPVRTNMQLFSTEYLLEHIYRKYPIPQTISIIQGEMQMLYPKLTKRMEKTTREIYALPWIEPASHTLSHPFYWEDVIKPKNASPKIGKNYHLPLKGYHFSLKKETIGSVEYALSFAPQSKQKEKILFWSGDCQPPQEVLEYVEKKGIITMNGGDTTVQKSTPNLHYIAPFGLQRGNYWQIYTGQQNENVYTNDWLGPFWGFRNVIETFKMTNKPYRIKPINIYYHFYAGSKLASFNALKEVYDWAIAQKTSKLYASQYIKKGRGFYRTAIGKTEQGFEIRNQGFLRTMRFDKTIHIDMKTSQGVAGYIHEQDTTYVTLDSSENYSINFSSSKKSPYLIDSNGWVKHVKNNSFQLQSNVAIEANFYVPDSCTYSLNKNIKKTKNKQNLLLYSTNHKGVTVVFQCK